jgi:hypothetical protein
MLNLNEELLLNLRNVSFPIDGKLLFENILLSYKKKVKPQATRIIFKGSPLMPWFTPELRQNYPNAFILHILRDPRAVYASQKNNIQPYTKKAFTSTPIETAYDWRSAAQGVKKISGRRTIEIKYEDLLMDKEKTIQRVFEKLDISVFKTGKNTFSALIPEQEKSIHKKVNESLDQKRINAWQSELTKREIYLLEYFIDSNLISFF